MFRYNILIREVASRFVYWVVDDDPDILKMAEKNSRRRGTLQYRLYGGGCVARN